MEGSQGYETNSDDEFKVSSERQDKQGSLDRRPINSYISPNVVETKKRLDDISVSESSVS